MRPGMVKPTGRAARFDEHELIVSKTDPKGRITYANAVFQRVSGYAEAELLGAPHNIIRHPEMPAAVFKLLWDRLGAGHEVFAYVLNLARNGDHYWVFAHVTPTYDARGGLAGYHSNRRVPYADALEKVVPLYAEMRAVERRASDYRAGMAAAGAVLQGTLDRAGLDYDRFVFALSAHTGLGARAA